jgi:uncharacterized protein (DUF305 family)
MISAGLARRLVLALASLTLLAALTIPSPASASAPRSKAERAYLVDMVGHHSMAVEMAEMAQEKATHQELKDLAEDIIRTQSAEIEQMRSWLKRWYGREVGEHDMMTVHHTQAIERSQAVRRYPLHGKVRQLTRDIIRAQRREIAQLQDWLVAWYAN